MMRWKNGVLVAGLLGLACSGKYEVGEMDAAGGTAAGGTSSESTGGIAGSQSVGGSEPAGGCSPSGQPAMLTGTFVTPAVVWSRLAPMIWGSAHEPPEELPEAVTYAWAAQVVDTAIDQAVAETSGVPGATFFIQHWLGLEEGTEALEGNYAEKIDESENQLLEVLLVLTRGPGRSGVFTEPGWLERYPGVPQRGAVITRALFGRAVPGPPPGVDRSFTDEGVPDREWIETTTSQAPCRACHGLMDPLGYALLHFDRLGAYREQDHGLPIDTTGSYMLSNGTRLTFDGIVEFGQKASMTCDANTGIVDAFIDVALADRGYDDAASQAARLGSRDRIVQAYFANGLSYRGLLRGYAQSAAVLRP